MMASGGVLVRRSKTVLLSDIESTQPLEAISDEVWIIRNNFRFYLHKNHSSLYLKLRYIFKAADPFQQITEFIQILYFSLAF